LNGSPTMASIGMTYACGARQLLPLIEWRGTLDHPPVRYEPRQQPEAVKPPSSPLVQAEQRIGDVSPPILSDSELEDIIEAAIDEVFGSNEPKESTEPVPEISPEADKAMRELARLFGSDADDEPSKTPPNKQPK
jgi:hypothetical protein